MALSKVPGEEALYMGGVFTLRRPSALEGCNITHILSVLRGDLSDIRNIRPGVMWLQIELDDTDDEDLLENFPRTNEFIRDGLKSGGGVLVHCAMGVSRSATVILAYMLSTRPELTPQGALDLLREVRPIVGPNSGFMEQLELYHGMGCPSDITSQRKYQKWKYDQEVKLSIEAGRAPDVVRFEDEETKESEASSSAGSNDIELKCKKCRRTLATAPFIHPHTPRPQIARTGSTNIPNQIQSPGSSSSCMHHYIDALSWMRPELTKGELDGRLECPNPRCGTIVGRYAWQGMRCSCRAWVCPAITLQKARVDEVKKSEPIQGVRLPPGMLRGGVTVNQIQDRPGQSPGGGGGTKGNL